MAYLAQLTLGVARAFAAGGLLWRAIFWLFSGLPIGGAAATQFPFGQKMLADIGMSSVTIWHFLFAAAFIVAAFFACRISYLVTPRLKVLRIEKHKGEFGGESFRAVIKNCSFGDCYNVVAYFLEMDERWEQLLNEQAVDLVLDLPYVLPTHERQRRAATTADELPYGGFTLRKEQQKKIELFRINYIDNELFVRHQSGQLDLIAADWIMTYEIVGCGISLKFKVKILMDEGSAYGFLIRDDLDLLALSQLGATLWWRDGPGK